MSKTAQRGRVLIVDDTMDLRSILREILAPQHEVVVAADGIMALAKLDTSRFDVVLTDVRMPGPDGFELVRLIKKRWPLTEVVLMTAYPSIRAAVEALRLDAYDYLEKPFDPDEVTLVVARALERHRERARVEGAEPEVEQLATFSYREALADARDRGSRDYLVALLKVFKGNVSRAAERAGLERESLHRLLRRHGIDADCFRASGPTGTSPGCTSGGPHT
jgi:DNA-binding NtrC family response regulator